MRKTFISYHHENEQDLKDNLIKRYGGNHFINKSVSDGDINSDNTEETIMRSIRQDFLYDSTVTLVIVGEKTSSRPFINSEIQASLWGDNSNGLLAVVRDEVYNTVYSFSPCKHWNCNCGQYMRYKTSWFTHYIPDLVHRNNEYDSRVPHYQDSDVYCSITKYSDFIQNPETYIQGAFLKRGKFEIVKKLLDSTPKISSRSSWW